MIWITIFTTIYTLIAIGHYCIIYILDKEYNMTPYGHFQAWLIIIFWPVLWLYDTIRNIKK